MDSQLVDTARSQASRWLRLAERLVAIDTGPGDLEGAQRICTVLSDQWRQAGFSVELLPTVPPVLKAYRTAQTEKPSRVLLLGHYDTVFAAGTAQIRPMAIRSGRASGPGVADMKLGLVTQLAAVSLAGSLHCDVTVLINGDEESGSVASRDVIQSEASAADAVLVFEPGEPEGHIVQSRPGVSRFRVRTIGKAAHTGVAPETGRNAIEGLAHLALAVQALGRSNRYGTVTVSMIEGGTRPNVVPASAEMVIDARVPDAPAAQALRGELERLAKSVPIDGVGAEVMSLDARPPLTATDASTALANRLSVISAQQGTQLELADGRGTSDGNLTSSFGIPTVDGLGPPGGDLHTDEEWADVDGVFTRAATIAAYLGGLG